MSANASAHQQWEQVLSDHVNMLIRRGIAAWRSDTGRVEQINPVKIFMQGSNLSVPETVLMFSHSCPKQSLRVNDIVAVTVVEGWYCVLEVVSLGNTTLPAGSTKLVEINSTGLTSSQVDKLFVRPPANGTSVSDPTNNLLLVRQNGVWRKVATSVL
jgi:hypothetical protein